MIVFAPRPIPSRRAFCLPRSQVHWFIAASTAGTSLAWDKPSHAIFGEQNGSGFAPNLRRLLSYPIVFAGISLFWSTVFFSEARILWGLLPRSPVSAC
jgi:hypothetical protein